MNEIGNYFNLKAKELIPLYERITPSALYQVIECTFKPEGVTLDVGSGCGRDVVYLRSRGYNAFGIDLSDEMVNHAIMTHGDYFSKRDLLDTVVHYDNILCSGVLHYYYNYIDVFRRLLILTKDALVVSFRAPKNDREYEVSLRSLISEAKKYGLSMHITHQDDTWTTIGFKR